MNRYSFSPAKFARLGTKHRLKLRLELTDLGRHLFLGGFAFHGVLETGRISVLVEALDLAIAKPPYVTNLEIELFAGWFI